MAAKRRTEAGLERSSLARRILQQRRPGQVDIELERLEAELGDVRRYDIVASLKELEKAGAGRLRVGRKGKKSRFVWEPAAAGEATPAVAAPPQVTTPAAPRPPEAVSRLPRGGEPASRGGADESRMLRHSFHVRPGVVATFDLPADITLAEIERLCLLLRAVPFN